LSIFKASALGLFEPDEPDSKTMYSSLIQNFNRFVLEQLHQECSLDRASVAGLNAPAGLASSPIQRVFGMKTASTNICGHCGLEEERITYPFVLDLMWPKPVSLAPLNNRSTKLSLNRLSSKRLPDN